MGFSKGFLCFVFVFFVCVFFCVCWVDLESLFSVFCFLIFCVYWVGWESTLFFLVILWSCGLLFLFIYCLNHCLVVWTAFQPLLCVSFVFFTVVLAGSLHPAKQHLRQTHCPKAEIAVFLVSWNQLTCWFVQRLNSWPCSTSNRSWNTRFRTYDSSTLFRWQGRVLTPRAHFSLRLHLKCHTSQLLGLTEFWRVKFFMKEVVWFVLRGKTVYPTQPIIPIWLVLREKTVYPTQPIITKMQQQKKPLRVTASPKQDSMKVRRSNKASLAEKIPYRADKAWRRVL